MKSSEDAAGASKSINEFGSIGVGLAEVELPAAFKQRNAIETEIATAELHLAADGNGELPNSTRHQIGGNFHFRREPLARHPKNFNSDNEAFSKFFKSWRR